MDDDLKMGLSLTITIRELPTTQFSAKAKLGILFDQWRIKFGNLPKEHTIKILIGLAWISAFKN